MSYLYDAQSGYVNRQHDWMTSRVSDLALDFFSFEQVDENLETAYVTNGELTRFLLQVKIAHRTQSNDRCSLVSTL